MKKRLTVLVLAFAMVLTMSASVFAVGGATDAAGDKAKGPGDAYLVKYLKKAEGVANPNASFTFTLKAQDPMTITVKDSNPAKTSTTAEKAAYPGAGDDITTSAINASDMESAGIAGTSDTVGKIKIADIFAGKTFKHAGEYVYEVSENATFTEDTDKNTKETMNNDDQKYYLHLYVVNKGTGNETEIENVTVEKQNGTKVDPSDVNPAPTVTETSNPRDDANYKADGFTFTNAYTVETQNITDPDDPEKDPVDPDDPESYAGFGVSKTVAGKYADRSKDFTFKVKITAPKGYTTTTGKYIISEMNDADQTMSAGAEQSFTYGTEFTVSMHHGEHFGVTEMALGSKVEITEVAAQYYTPKAEGLITVDEASSDNVACTGNVVVGSANKGQVAAFTNTMKDDDAPTPTGIIINNLPYVLLIAIAFAGIVLFSRKRRYE